MVPIIHWLLYSRNPCTLILSASKRQLTRLGLLVVRNNTRDENRKCQSSCLSSSSIQHIQCYIQQSCNPFPLQNSLNLEHTCTIKRNSSVVAFSKKSLTYASKGFATNSLLRIQYKSTEQQETKGHCKSLSIALFQLLIGYLSVA